MLKLIVQCFSSNWQVKCLVRDDEPRKSLCMVIHFQSVIGDIESISNELSCHLLVEITNILADTIIQINI